MKSLKEYIVDDRLNKYIIDELIFSIECLLHFYSPDLVLESHGRFANYDLVIKRIAERIVKEIDNSSLEECAGKSYEIDCRDCEAYCKYVNVTIEKNGNVKDCGAVFVKKENDIISLILELNPYWSLELIALEGAILHELIHAYEDNEKMKENLPSIFDEFSEDYFNSKEHINIEIDPITAMVTLKYYLDPHERNAFFGALEKDIERVIKDIKPGKYVPKLSEIKNELQKLTSWRRYFEFCKFALDLKSYSDKSLEKAYYKVVISKDTQKENIRKSIEDFKVGKKSDYDYVKSASEIRKEIKAKYIKFVRKFNQLFPKVYADYLEKNL